jgi:Tfp pilus assembly protein PilE
MFLLNRIFDDRSVSKSITMIELIMVILIMAILASISIPRFIDIRKDANKAQCFGSGAAIQIALNNYYNRRAIDGNEEFPSSLHDSESYAQYLAERTLPGHPLGRDWNSYYSSNTGVIRLGKNSNDGVCTNF